MVGGDDGFAHRQAQAHARRGGFAFAASEFLEDPAFGASGHAGAIVADRDAQFLVLHGRAQLDGAASRRVLGRVFQQVAEHALDQHAVAFHQRQLGQAGHRHLVRGQWFAHGRQRRAHQFLYRLPFQPQRRVAALQPGHVQQVGHQRMHALGLVAHRADGVLHIGRQHGLLACQRVGHADQAGQRRAQVVRHRGKQRVAQLLGFHADQRLLRHLDIMQALERDGDQRGVGFDLTPRFGIGEQAAARRGQRQDAAGAHGAFSGR